MHRVASPIWSRVLVCVLHAYSIADCNTIAIPSRRMHYFVPQRLSACAYSFRNPRIGNAPPSFHTRFRMPDRRGHYRNCTTFSHGEMPEEGLPNAYLCNSAATVLPSACRNFLHYVSTHGARSREKPDRLCVPALRSDSEDGARLSFSAMKYIRISGNGTHPARASPSCALSILRIAGT